MLCTCRVKKQSQVYQDGQWQKLQPEDRLKLTLHEAQVSYNSPTSSYTHDYRCTIVKALLWICISGMLTPLKSIISF